MNFLTRMIISSPLVLRQGQLHCVDEGRLQQNINPAAGLPSSGLLDRCLRMSKMFLRLESVPRRIVSEREAADYCGLTVATFRRLCPVNPIDLGNSRRAFDLHDLDAWVEAIKADTQAPDDEVLGRLS